MSSVNESKDQIKENSLLTDFTFQRRIRIVSVGTLYPVLVFNVGSKL